ncbi:DnaT-like ssDNA-binding domain-containing protein [Pontibacter sp. JAM-7]|uniref:DnaT-like ssDNA-binding domain-containing protein n=1 Tax=Pontibacter sp. JAM-7 TaxID=3366581 RepID=UPI003AF8C88E
MSFQFPESPLLLYPSLIDALGVDGALLLTLYHQHSQQQGNSSWQLDNAAWLALARYWEEDQVAQLTSMLVEAGYIDARFSPEGAVKVRFLDFSEDTQLDYSEAASAEVVSRLPVLETSPPRPKPLAETVPQAGVGPAPTFGGSIGWARNNRQGDELHALFQQHETRNQQLHTMHMGWQPSENFFALLPRHNIANDFARGCVDEFVLYWLDKDRKETNWDQKFLGWVKREWVHKQTEAGRQQRIQQERKSGEFHENARKDTRENRKRVTQAIMDIRDTDW